MIQKYSAFKIFTIVFLLLFVSAFGWSMIYKELKANNGGADHPRSLPENTTQNDVKVLERLVKISNQFNNIEKDSFYKGKFTAVNEADSSDNIINVDFIAARQGEDMYYKVADTEFLNVKGIYLQIDHVGKKVVVSEQKRQISFPAIVGTEKLKQAFESEGYQLHLKENGPLEVISLINNNHITCKEYTISFDSKSGRVNRIFTRFTNQGDPLRTDNEKIVDFEIKEWRDEVMIQDYLDPEDVVRKTGDEWVLVDEYASYDLIRL